MIFIKISSFNSKPNLHYPIINVSIKDEQLMYIINCIGTGYAKILNIIGSLSDKVETYVDLV